MKRLIFALAALAPFAAAAQGLLGRASIGDALDTMDRLQAMAEHRRGLDQIFVLPERAGQNQVAWYGFEWEYVDVPPPGGGKGGIRLYYYRNEAAQARRALPAIQSAFARLVDQFHYSPTTRVPYMLYATQREFQTQNVFQVTESVLGVTSPENLKMAVPYFGDHQKFVEVSTHEMVHQFTIQKLKDQERADESSSAIQMLPLWYIEGIAEYYSKGGIDAETDLYLRDLVWNPDPTKGYAILPFAEDRIRGYIATYKLGQARCAFIADVYGKEKVQGFLENAYLLVNADTRSSSPVRNFAALVRRVLNEPIEQVDQRWRAWLKRRYYPEYARVREDLPQLREVRQLPNEPEIFSASPDGNVVVARTLDRQRGRARLHLFDLRNPHGAVEIAADSQPGLESLHPVEQQVAAVGPHFALFSAQAGIGDQVYLQPYRDDVKEGKPPSILLGHRRTIDVRPPGGRRFIVIADPAISPDEKEFAFVGVGTDGQQDIYVASVRGGEARRITNDPYSEKDLAWGADGIYYASDATDHGRANLFRIDPKTGDRTRLTTEPASDRYPAPLADGSVLFSSDVKGKTDVYSLRDGKVQQITDFTTALTRPELAPKGRGILASTYHGGEFRLVEVPKVTWLDGGAVAVAPPAGDVLEIPSASFPADVTDYEAFALKNWRPEAGFVYGGGAGGAVAGRAAVLFTDTLRDHVVFVDVSVLGSFNYTQGIVLYENRAKRVGYSFGAFHFVQQNIDQMDTNLAFLQRDFGIVGAYRYPFDRFRRLELELSAGGTQRWCPVDLTNVLSAGCNDVTFSPVYNAPTRSPADVWLSRNGGVAPFVSPAVRLGYDTIRYDMYTGPLSGHSLLGELGGGYLPTRSAVHGFFRFDAQQYFQISGRANIGFRAAGGSSFAPDERSRIWARSWWLSSADNLRGLDPLDFKDLVALNYWVANAELQVPLDALIHLFIFEYVEGVAAMDFGGVFNHWSTTEIPFNTAVQLTCPGRETTREPARCADLGFWDSRTLTGVLGVNVLFGPLLLRVHFGHPFDVGGVLTPALARGQRWVTNITLRYFFM